MLASKSWGCQILLESRVVTCWVIVPATHSPTAALSLTFSTSSSWSVRRVQLWRRPWSLSGWRRQAAVQAGAGARPCVSSFRHNAGPEWKEARQRHTTAYTWAAGPNVALISLRFNRQPAMLCPCYEGGSIYFWETLEARNWKMQLMNRKQ